MKEETKELLFEAWDYCDREDKSTGFMLSYMADVADIPFDDVMEFIQNESGNRKAWYDRQLKH